MKKNKFFFLLFFSTWGLCFHSCQEGNVFFETNGPAIEIKRTDIQSKSVTVQFIPTAEVAGFDLFIGNAEDFQDFVSGAAEGVQRQEGNQTVIKSFDNLQPESVYTVFARAFDSDRNLGPVSSMEITTLSENPSGEQSDFSVTVAYLTEDEVAFVVKTTPDIYTYRYYFGLPGERENFVSKEIKGTVANDVYQYTYTYSDLNPGTEYAFFAVATDRRDDRETLQVIEAKTYSDINEGPSVDFTINHVDFAYGNFTLKGNEHCSAITLLIDSKGYFSDLVDDWDGSILSIVDNFESDIEAGNMQTNAFSKTGRLLEVETFSTSFNLSRLMYDAPLEAYVIAYNDKGLPPSIKYYTFATTSNPNANKENLKVDARFDRIENGSIFYSVVPEKDVYLIVSTVVTEEWLNNFNGTDEERVNSLISNISYGLGAMIYHGAGRFGNTSYEVEDYAEYGKLYLFAIGTNINGPYYGEYGSEKSGWGDYVLVPFDGLKMDNAK